VSKAGVCDRRFAQVERDDVFDLRQWRKLLVGAGRPLQVKIDFTVLVVLCNLTDAAARLFDLCNGLRFGIGGPSLLLGLGRFGKKPSQTQAVSSQE